MKLVRFDGPVNGVQYSWMGRPKVGDVYYVTDRDWDSIVKHDPAKFSLCDLKVKRLRVVNEADVNRVRERDLCERSRLELIEMARNMVKTPIPPSRFRIYSRRQLARIIISSMVAALCVLDVVGAVRLTGTLTDASGVGRANLNLRFVPRNTPMSIPPSLITRTDVITNTDGSGNFALDLHPGTYSLVIDPDTVQLTIPNTVTNIDLLDAITSRVYTTNQVAPAYILRGGDTMNGTLLWSTATNYAGAVGLIVKSMTETERDAATATNGAIVYNTTAGVLNKMEGGVWSVFGSGSGGGSVTNLTELTNSTPIVGGGGGGLYSTNTSGFLLLIGAQAASANLSGWSALATSSKQDALGYAPQAGAPALTNLANAGTVGSGSVVLSNAPSVSDPTFIGVVTSTNLDAKLADHATDTTLVHGIADTSALVTSAYADLVSETKVGTGSAQVAAGDHTHAQLHDRAHSTASATDHTDWPLGLTVIELGYLDGVTNGIQDQINGKASNTFAGITNALGVFSGSTSTFLRADGTMSVPSVSSGTSFDFGVDGGYTTVSLSFGEDL